ncbi:MAG: DUF86 domain-containing protein, partial [Burkholderiaceae bacterium]|nr:DUF86 domain-containing protein [Burkholderiaceae bacterium]
HTLETFTSNRVLCLAVEKLFINLGEAAYRVDSESASQWPDIPWRRVIGLRNILAHGYEQVAHEILLKTITDDLPTLEHAITQALECTELRDGEQ